MYELLYDFDVLLQSFEKAKKGKRWKNSTNKFEMNKLEAVLLLQHLLKTKTYNIPPYNEFRITTPKERIIKSSPFKDKVIQHALCDYVLEPVLERHYIYDSYASRKGKGVHAGLQRTKEFMRKQYRMNGLNSWVLKCDIEKYFDSIDHEILRSKLRRLINDPDVLGLIDLIIDSTENPGLPIGNQTSQHFSLIYLSDFDHFIKEKLRIKHYIRYMDDFVLFHPDKEYLKHCKREIIRYLAEEKLKLNHKSHIFPLRNGVDFLGFHCYLTESGKVISKVRRDSKKRVKRKLKKFKELYRSGERSKEEIQQSFQSWVTHASHGNSHHLVRNMQRKFDEIFEEGPHAKNNQPARGSQSKRGGHYL